MAGAAADAEDAVRMEMEQSVVALEGTAAVVQHSTSGSFAVIEMLARTCGVDRDQKERLQKLGNSTEEYDR